MKLVKQEKKIPFPNHNLMFNSDGVKKLIVIPFTTIKTFVSNIFSQRIFFFFNYRLEINKGKSLRKWKHVKENTSKKLEKIYPHNLTF